MSTADLARRFLHVNLNTTDAEVAQRFFVDCLGLRLQMRTDPESLTDGEILGLSGKVRVDGRFYYDSRGPRSSCAIELIEWLDPATTPCAPPGAASAGLIALGFLVADRVGVVEALSHNGFRVARSTATGFVTDAPATLVIGPDGVTVEIGDLPSASRGPVRFAGLHISCVDLATSLAFYTGIGFVQLDEIATRTVRLRDIGVDLDGSDDVLICPIGLPEDHVTAKVCLTQRLTPGTSLILKQPNQQGLYRCALRVESTQGAIAATTDTITVRGPLWCPLPGTPIDGLNVAFLTAPEGVVIEFVERPLSHFAPRTAELG
ncbi:VOC family protein [Mycobacterium sp.]|uniref:VOC family protein n=1 Tax=Mycobacterium sp. TaxID=1785 RepID=UPI0012116C47|nr:VOC family protein [Mycobacterium sp.]TAM65127.1 MAG: VOC family protein [Mycobacterium sp.]